MMPLAQALTTFSADDVLSPYVYVFYGAFVLSFIFTPVMRRVATYYGIIDQPDNKRKMHRTPVAYLGGVAVFLGWIGGLTISQFTHMHRVAPGLDAHVVIPWSIVVAATLIVLLGLWDDTKHITPNVKILGQVTAALLLLANGVGTQATLPMLRPITVRTSMWFGWPDTAYPPESLVLITSCVMVVAIVVFCCNATNLMDGLDGLCGGVTAIVAIGYTIIAVYLAMFGQGDTANWDAARVVLALSLLGAVLGFVPYNFNPASIFMGDTGSMFLGFSCGLMIVLMAEVENKWFLAAMVMFALPVMDTSLAFARRYVNGRPLFSADKHHLHHQLVARGLTVRQAVILSYGLAIAFVILGAAIVIMRTRYALMAYLVIFGSIIVAAYKMGMVHERAVVTKRKPLGEDDLEATPASAGDMGGSVLEVQDEPPAFGPNGQVVAPPGAWSPLATRSAPPAAQNSASPLPAPPSDFPAEQT
jgi:UDP-GlcNAc:undecaprenyl-phosphate/decaprenyl-phosphate GlcNAc-1-phosphate transferase